MATRREEIEKMLKEREMAAHELARELNIPIKEIIEDLKHIKLSNKGKFVINHAVCKACGFVFTKEGKVSKPSKCPKCSSERIQDPTFMIKQKNKKPEEQKLSEIFAK